MKQETPTLTVQPREKTGSRYAQRLRQQGRLPGVIYGHKTAPVSVSVDERQILDMLTHGAHAVNVKVEGGKSETCLVKELQYGYLGDNLVHVDFARVKLDEEVDVHVQLTFTGTPEAAKQADSILSYELTELEVRCKVKDIPEEIKVDLNGMTETHMAARELVLPAGVELVTDEDATVVSVSFLREEEETGEEAAVETDGAEPEVITEAKAEGDESS